MIKLIALASSIAVGGCADMGTDNAQARSENSLCKAEFSMHISEEGLHTMVLARELGMASELDQFQKIQSDTGSSCQQVKDAWTVFSESVEKKVHK